MICHHEKQSRSFISYDTRRGWKSVLGLLLGTEACCSKALEEWVFLRVKAIKGPPRFAQNLSKSNYTWSNNQQNLKKEVCSKLLLCTHALRRCNTSLNSQTFATRSRPRGQSPQRFLHHAGSGSLGTDATRTMLPAIRSKVFRYLGT